jgi:hypothetical protein
VIFTLAEALLTHSETRKTLGIKIIHLWLQFKIYEVLDIHTNPKGNSENKEKRKKVGETFRGYNFTGSDLLSLLKACCTIIEQGTEDTQDMADMIVKGRGSELEQVFYKEPEPEPEPVSYNPDKSI